MHGTPSRFNDPARFSFAHGGKDGHPFPVPLKIYDESIEVLKNTIQKAKLGESDKHKAIKSLSILAQKLEQEFIPNNNFDQIIKKEKEESYKHGGMSVFGKAQPPANIDKHGQMNLF